MIFGLSKQTIDQLKKVFINHPSISKVVIYGSRALGNYSEGSDIDLAIMSDSISFTELLKIKTEICDMPIPYKVDISHVSKIENQELLKHIKSKGKLFYTKSQ
jgi:predicted nucleotidyltransferase